MSKRSTLPSLQGMRGAAAVAVVMHHAALSTDAFVPAGFGSGLGQWMQWGYLGASRSLDLLKFQGLESLCSDSMSTATP